MLVAELKKEIKKYGLAEKDKIIIELYKRIPKKVKEDYDIDHFIMNIDHKAEKEKKKVTIEELEKEVNYFLDCANKGYYSSPNKVISKKERSQWRFTARRFYKELNAIPPKSEAGEKATDLLGKLYKILSVGSNYLTFVNWETFRAIQVEQHEFLDTIIKRKFVNGVTHENLLYAISLLDVPYDPYGCVHDRMLLVFRSNLSTREMKTTAIELLKEEVKMRQEKLTLAKKEKKRTYDIEEYLHHFVECITEIYFDLSEVDKGITYFHKNYAHFNMEIKEYILLNIIEMCLGLEEEWQEEYEKHIGKIDYRESLKRTYKELKEKIEV